jgi:succinyl-CoA synthetase beta subunit
MARLHEYQGKQLLTGHGIAVPRGRAVSTPDEAAAVAREIAAPVVVKIQAWTTNRKALGGVAFASTPDEAAAHARRMLGMTVGNFPVTQVLVEEALPIKDELFVSLFIDDRARRPAMLLSLTGGSGIEERAREGGRDGTVHRLTCDVMTGPDDAEVRATLARSKISRDDHAAIAAAVRAVFAAARTNEARSVEINPLVTTTEGRVIAADCRMTIDDYAVFRHTNLGIDIARELDHPPTALERIAYAVEQDDHRGTFYFAQLNTHAAPGSKGLIGFHGAGGGGSMMSMDAITNEGFTIANFTDTSGNPSAAKVYRAARIILCQPGLVGYFGSGSGVASQEQYWSAYGLAKAFWEVNMPIPAVIRLGGNSEDRAVAILQAACRALPAKVEGYKKDDPPRAIAQRFSQLVAQASRLRLPDQMARRVPPYVGAPHGFSFAIKGGTVWVDAGHWNRAAAELVAKHSRGLIKDTDGSPALAVSPEEAGGKDSELIACEVECRRAGKDLVFVDLDIPGLEDAVRLGQSDGKGAR